MKTTRKTIFSINSKLTQNWCNNKDDKNVILLKIWMKDNENRKKGQRRPLVYECKNQNIHLFSNTNCQVDAKPQNQ